MKDRRLTRKVPLLGGQKASDDSHGAAWRSRHDGNTMPYESAYLSDKTIGDAQLGRLRKIIKEIGCISE